MKPCRRQLSVFPKPSSNRTHTMLVAFCLAACVSIIVATLLHDR